MKLHVRALSLVALAGLLSMACTGAGTAPTATTAASARPSTPATVAPAATPAPAAAATAAPATPGRAKARMNTIGACFENYNWWAQEKGTYAKHGLDMEQIRTFGGAASLAAVVSGSVDFAFVNGFTAIQAYAQGFPIQLVAGGGVTAMPPLPSAMGVWVKNDSPLRAAAGLKGKKVAVNELAGLNQIVTSAWLKKVGVDPTDVRFVALPFAQIIPAVLSGTVDAAQVPHASVPTASVQQVRSIADPFVEIGTKVLQGGYVATKDFVAKNPKVVESFQAAIREAVAGVEANRAESTEVLARGCKGDLNVLKTVPQPATEADLDMAMVRAMAQMMVDQTILGALPDVEPLVPASARKK